MNFLYLNRWRFSKGSHVGIPRADKTYRFFSIWLDRFFLMENRCIKSRTNNSINNLHVRSNTKLTIIQSSINLFSFLTHPEVYFLMYLGIGAENETIEILGICCLRVIILGRVQNTRTEIWPSNKLVSWLDLFFLLSPKHTLRTVNSPEWKRVQWYWFGECTASFAAILEH